MKEKKKVVYPPTLLCDFYKLSHREQYTKGTQHVYSTWTPRSNKHHPSCDYVVWFGLQAFIKRWLINYFSLNFFKRKKVEVVSEYATFIEDTLGITDVDASHIADLHDLGYLPIDIRAIPEGHKVPIGIPCMSIHNTDPKFFWVTNWLETLISCELWQSSTSATIAHEYRKVFDEYAMHTVGSVDFVPFQGHDFSMRGMSSLDSAAKSGAGHLLSFLGTDTIPAINFLEYYYMADRTKGLIGTSVPATEHSVMCVGGDGEDEYRTFKRLITSVYPTGIVSIVSDTWDLWHVVEETLPRLKTEILGREGKVVIRPDSGDPELILCGDPHSDRPVVQKGLVHALWDTFGGSVNEKGYKELNPCIGAIYGDAITLDRAKSICANLMAQGFATTNVVYGIGSYTYQYNTRDTFGWAMKASLAVVDGQSKSIYKDPTTDDGTKKSFKGGVRVLYDGEWRVTDGLTFEQVRAIPEDSTMLKPVYQNGILWKMTDLNKVKEILNGKN